MAHHKRRGTGRVPPGNRSQEGPAGSVSSLSQSKRGRGTGFQSQDPKRRMGDYQTAGEHARQQPSALNDGQQHSQ